MKNEMSRILKSLMLLLLMPTSAFASNSGRGGGDVVILPDDTVVLADSFGVRIDDEPQKGDILFAPEIIQEIDLMENIFTGFWEHTMVQQEAARHARSYGQAVILDSNIEYYTVSKLPNIAACNSAVSYPWIPAGASVARVACTDSLKTWIVADLFAKLTVRQQALLLLHEGLRRFSEPAFKDQEIYKMTSGIAVALDHFQKQIRGERNVLSSQERTQYLSAIRLFLKAAYGSTSEGVGYLQNLTVYRRGGALLNTYEAQDFERKNAYLGIGVLLTTVADFGTNVSLVDTNICGRPAICFLGDNVDIASAWTKGDRVTLRGNNTLHSAIFSNYMRLNQEHGSSIKNVQLNHNGILDLKMNAELKNLREASYSSPNTSIALRIGGSLDFENKMFCQKGTTNRFKKPFFAANEVSSVEEMSARCE